MTGARWTRKELIATAQCGIGKIDTMGVRGITLCSMSEIEALAIVAATSPLLNPPAETKPDEESDHG